MEAPGENLLIKLWETLAEKGIGGLLQPWHEKRLGKARISIRKDELLILAQAEKQADDIRSGKATYSPQGEIKLVTNTLAQVDQNGRIEPTIDLSGLIINTSRIEISEKIRKEVNVAKAVIIAEDILADDSQDPSETTIDDDWLFLWRENAGRVSSEELQSLWGKILAGELKQPGSYSIRTMDFLKSLSKTDAELISKIAKFVIGDRIYRHKDIYLEKEGVTFSRLLFLQDIGFLSGVESTGLSSTYGSVDKDKFFNLLKANNKIIILNHDDPNKTVNAEVYLLTSVGIEVLKLANFQVDNEYLESTATDYVKKGFSVQIADFIQTNGSVHLLNTRQVVG